MTTLGPDPLGAAERAAIALEVASLMRHDLRNKLSAIRNAAFYIRRRAEKSDLIGTLNGGWAIAQTTLGYERGANSLGRVTRYAIAFDQLVKATRRLRRNGRPLIEDASVRARIGRLYAEEGPPRELAEMLIDIESSPDVGRWEVIDALRAIVPPEERLT